MTREQFERFMDEEQWTPEQRAHWWAMTPKCSVKQFVSELVRYDGIVPVEIHRERLN